MNKSNNQRERSKLMDLLKVGLIDPEFYNEENNTLLSEYSKAERKLSDLKTFQNKADERLEAAEKLVGFLNQRKISTVFDDDAFRYSITTMRLNSKLYFAILKLTS